MVCANDRLNGKKLPNWRNFIICGRQDGYLYKTQVVSYRQLGKTKIWLVVISELIRQRVLAFLADALHTGKVDAFRDAFHQIGERLRSDPLNTVYPP
jgi:hypothetical protein